MIPLKSLSLFACILCLLSLAGCGGQMLSPPPATVGDTSITVTVQLSSAGRFPKGANAVITLADISGPAPTPLAGDSVTLHEADRSFRVSLPADKHKIGKCRTSGKCGIFVNVLHNGKALYRNTNPIPYSLQTKNVVIPVSSV